MTQLQPLPETRIGPRLYRQKWLICDETGAPLTATAGRYSDGYRARYIEAPEERARLLELKREYRGQTVVSRPDAPSDGARVRFEIHLEAERETVAPTERPAPKVALQMEML